MSLRIPFSKYHGLGNDFLVVDLRAGAPLLDADTVVRLCDRHRGVGGDGVLSILPPTEPGADLRMRVQNADGSEPETCGNGIRVFTLHAVTRLDGYVGRDRLSVQTGAGVSVVEVTAPGRFRVDMGRPELDAAEVPVAAPLPTHGRVLDAPLQAGERAVRVTAVSMGNPHAVIFEGATPEDAPALGGDLERHPAFPRRANVGFARRTAEDAIDLVVWERGVGITQACGSGACAAVVAGVETGRLPAGREVAVKLPGGVLRIEVAPDLSRVFMTGPAAHVFEGSFDLDAFAGEGAP